MKQKLLTLIFLTISSTTMATAENTMFGLHCGPRGNFWSAILSDFAIPDYFPPENALISALLMDVLGLDVSMCEDLEAVHLGESCMMHDQCYSTLGVTKDFCDENLIQGWQTSCMTNYTDASEEANSCKTLCQEMTNFMYSLMRYDDGIFCPSCIAFDKSQEQAREEMAP